MQDELFMRRALVLAENSVKCGNEPFGAVLVKDGVVVCENGNSVFSERNPLLHAETGLLFKFIGQTGVTDLSEYTLYTSCEPCFMCSGCMVWAKLGRLVFGAYSKDLAEIRGKSGRNPSALVFENSTHKPKVTGGVLRDECVKVLKDYFENR